MQTPTMRSWLRAVAVGVAVASAAVLGAPVAGASPSYTTITDATLVTASDNWVLYTVDMEGTRPPKLIAQPTDGGKPVTVPAYNGWDPTGALKLDRDVLLYNPTPGGVSTDDHTWVDLRTGATGTVPSARRWNYAAPNGGVYTAFDKATQSVHAYRQNAVSGHVTDLGALPGFVKASSATGITGTTSDLGVLFFEYQRSGNFDVVVTDYLRWSAPDRVTHVDPDVVNKGGYCELTTDAYGCVLPGSTTDLNEIVRLPLDGSAAPPPVQVTLPQWKKGANPFVVPLLTTTRTGWIFYVDPDDGVYGPFGPSYLRSVPASGTGPHQKSTFQMPFGRGADAAVSGGDALYVIHPQAGAVYTVSTDDTTQKLLAQLVK